MDCPGCGCLIDGAEAACPFCGASVRSAGAPVWLLVGLALGVGIVDISCADKGEPVVSDAGSDSATVTASQSSGETSSSSGASGSGDLVTTTNPNPSNADASTYAGPDETATTNTFLGADGSTYAGPDEPPCDAFAQDCPNDQKCAAIITDGGSSWDAVGCVPVSGSGQAGDVCVSESVAEGLDDCDKGFMCWDVDDKQMGTCVKLCEGTADAPICPEMGHCTIANDGALNLCLPVCSPLLQDCAEGNACYPVADSFTCAPDASGDTGVANDPCEFINVCQAGLMCADAAFVGAGCPQGSTGCCTPFCDLSDPAPCPNPDQSCVPFFDPMNLPVNPQDAADIGSCGVPI